MTPRTPPLPRTLLVVARSFDERLTAQRVAAAIASGLEAEGWPTDLCPIDSGEAPPAGSAGRVRALDDLDFDARMRSARAVILAERRLQEDTLAGSAVFEIATRARQAGVPVCAVTAENRLDSFDARILDLQAILEAGSARSLRAAGRRLAGLL
jgi:glycerate kinase